MSIHNFPGSDDTLGEDEGPNLYDYVVEFKDGTKITVHGYLTITPSIVAIGFSATGEVSYASTWDNVRQVYKVETNALNG